MSYQVLARKWRPKNFKQMVGQEHVLQALIHALDSQRIHHAYLFTGTRGVGKTTIGRILARCLSCEKGITSEPCGTCSACDAISQGRYVDLIEIDAASRTKVEDMRELLENVQYAPAQGRFKIYLIDEVHMLSSHSFNALLKTLEEPPEHVKFLFATTDPQKLPVTILSRCLQFNLKNMTPDKIVAHLTYILDQEKVSSEEAALWALARAADGSMRDALSLTDQAIAYTEGELKEGPVSAMLGAVDQKKVYGILDALVSRDAKLLLDLIGGLAEFSPDYSLVLELISSVFHRVAVEQVVPGATDNAQGDQDRIVFYARNLSAEDVQLYYQIALVSRKDMAITPDPRAGFIMALLRMLAFQLEIPDSAERAPLPLSSVAASENEKSIESEVSLNSANNAESVEPQLDEVLAPAPSEPDKAESQPQLQPEPKPEPKPEPQPEPQPQVQTSDLNDGELSESPSLEAHDYELPPVDAYEQAAEIETESLFEDGYSNGVDLDPNEDHEALSGGKKKTHDLAAASIAELATETRSGAAQATLSQADVPQIEAPKAQDTRLESADSAQVDSELVDSELLQDMVWPRQAIRLGLSGMTQNLLFNMYKEDRGGNLRMYVESGHFRLLTKNHQGRIESALTNLLANVSSIEFVDGLLEGQETPAMWRERMGAERLEQTKKSLYLDPNVQSLLSAFDGQLLEESIVVLGDIN